MFQYITKGLDYIKTMVKSSADNNTTPKEIDVDEEGEKYFSCRLVIFLY